MRIVVAYATRSGCQRLINSIGARISVDSVNAIPKLMVTSFDFGHTEPSALTYWMNLPNAEVRIANIQRTRGVLTVTPSTTNFHPKVYVLDHPNRVSVMIGSANLTGRGLTVNTEAAIADPATDAQAINNLWMGSWESAEPLTDVLLDEYRAVRPGRPVPNIDPAVPPLPRRVARRLIDAINAGLDPSEFQFLWIQAGSMTSGGSNNQLELPRGANTFFDFHFNAYGPDHVIIGRPPLIARRRRWIDRPLTWHSGGGQNGMERLNLPTVRQDGFVYAETAILFRRIQNGYEISVTPWTGDQANAWVNASIGRGSIYSVGRGRNSRICGLF